MGIGTRDYILVIGNQGCGKTAWTRAYSKAASRMLVFDPKAEYPDVDYLTPPDEIIPAIVSGERREFRYGSYMPEELEMLGSAAYAAGRSLLLMEECALLFNRGEDIAPWARPIVFMGREVGLDLVLVAQRAMRFPIDIRSQASRIITFAQSEPDDVKALCGRIGKQYAEEIISLPPLTCLDWKQGQGVKRYTVHP